MTTSVVVIAGWEGVMMTGRDIIARREATMISGSYVIGGRRPLMTFPDSSSLTAVG